MTVAPNFSSLYQLNTHVWLRHLSRERDQRTTLPEIAGGTIDGFARQGRLDLAIERLAGRRLGHLAQQPGMANRVQSCPVRPQRGQCRSGFAFAAYAVSHEIGERRGAGQFASGSPNTTSS